MRFVESPVRLQRTECRADRRTETVEQLDALRMQIDERDILLRGNAARRFGVLAKVRVNVSIDSEVPARERRDQDRLRARGTRLVDVTRHVRAEDRESGLAIESLAGDVVMAELHEDVARMLAERIAPMSLGGVTLRAPATT